MKQLTIIMESADVVRYEILEYCLWRAGWPNGLRSCFRNVSCSKPSLPRDGLAAYMANKKRL